MSNGTGGGVSESRSPARALTAVDRVNSDAHVMSERALMVCFEIVPGYCMHSPTSIGLCVDRSRRDNRGASLRWDRSRECLSGSDGRRAGALKGLREDCPPFEPPPCRRPAASNGGQAVS